MIAIWEHIFQVSILLITMFFNLYLFKVSSKSTFSLLFCGLTEIHLFFTFFEYRFPSLLLVYERCANCKYIDLCKPSFFSSLSRKDEIIAKSAFPQKQQVSLLAFTHSAC